MNNQYRSAAPLFLALAALTLSASVAQAEVRMPTHVACVGDSITAGSGASVPAKNYPSVLQSLFGASVQVKNFGSGGSTMLGPTYGDKPYVKQAVYTGATTFVSGAGASALVDVIIMLGTNDSKPINWSPANNPKNDKQYLIDYRAMVEHFTNLKPKPLVFLALPLATGNKPCCSINGTVIHDEILPLIKQLAAEKRLPTIDLNTPTTGHPEYFVDGVHPNDAAYAIVAKVMHDGLLVDLPTPGAGGAGGASSGGGAGVGGAGGGAGGGGAAGSGAGWGGSSGSADSGGIAGASAGSAGARGAGSPASAGASMLPSGPPDNETSCALAPGKVGSGTGAAFSLLLLALLGKRRRAARRMC